jgi:hypothetical protein
MSGHSFSRTPRRSGSRWPLALSSLVVLMLLLALSLFPAAASSSSPVLDAATRQTQLVDDQAEINYQPDYVYLATGDSNAQHAVYAWPFALQSIGHNIQSYQNYGSPYFHGGLDIMAPNGTMVYNRSGGQIVNIENYQPGNDLYWEVAILDPEGFLWQYHHIDHYTIPQYVKDKYNEYLADPVHGGVVPAGTYIGNIVYWPVGYPGSPTLFHHIHLNILGAGAEYLNGFEFHTALSDAAPPDIQVIGLLKNGQVYPGNQVSGSYGLYVRAHDLVLAPDWYWLPPYEVSFSVDGGPTTTTWRFDTLPGGADRNVFSTDFFVVPPSCGDYDCNEFYMNVGFTTSGPRQFPSASGTHTVTVNVRDYVGNSDTGTFTWTVTGGTTVHVGDLARIGRLQPRGYWQAQVSVLVHDQSHARVANATVTGIWSGGASGTSTCTTTTSGRCLVKKTKLAGDVPSVTFTITNITRTGYTYSPVDNHDANGDSNGTAITVIKP